MIQTNKQIGYNIKIKEIYINITTHALNLMNYFKSHKVVKITPNTKYMMKNQFIIQPSNNFIGLVLGIRDNGCSRTTVSILEFRN